METDPLCVDNIAGSIVICFPKTKPLKKYYLPLSGYLRHKNAYIIIGIIALGPDGKC